MPAFLAPPLCPCVTGRRDLAFTLSAAMATFPAMRLPLVHKLTYTWDGWPSQAGPPLPAEPDFSAIDPLWLGDGLQRMNSRWTHSLAQLSFEAEPSISPVLFTTRVKGRLDHALRKAGTPATFSRKVGMRAIGDNTDPVVARYLELQQVCGEFADQKYRQTLEEFSREYPEIDLEAPAETLSGRYWYNLHLVAVTNNRWRMGRGDYLPKLPAAVPAWAEEGGHALRAMALMPDHVHVIVRGNPQQSPCEIAESIYRALNRAAGLRLFSDRLYAGTFSSYAREAIGLAAGTSSIP